MLYGATGFVGKLVAQYIAEAAPEGVRVALAGRDPRRVTAVRDALPAHARSWTVLRADASQPETLKSMARSARVVVTTVGPYAEFGMPLVLACAEVGTDYADLTGEPLFVKDSIGAAHELARSNSARIVHSCGFDSVPSDLSVYLTYLRAVQDQAGELETATLVATVRGGMSGGTIASGRGQMRAIARDSSVQNVIDDPYMLSADRDNESAPGGQSDTAWFRASAIDATLSGWVASFIMAQHNTRIVRRSNSLLGWAYGKDFRYREVMSTGRSAASPLLAAVVAAGLKLQNTVGPLAHRGFGPNIVDRLVPKAGSGPSEAARNRGFFSMRTFSRTSSGAQYRTTFAADGDPGYKATAVILGEAALCLALDRDKLSQMTGVLTPATVMAEPLADRLRTAGVTIEIEKKS